MRPRRHSLAATASREPVVVWRFRHASGVYPRQQRTGPRAGTLRQRTSLDASWRSACGDGPAPGKSIATVERPGPVARRERASRARLLPREVQLTGESTHGSHVRERKKHGAVSRLDELDPHYRDRGEALPAPSLIGTSFGDAKLRRRRLAEGFGVTFWPRCPACRQLVRTRCGTMRTTSPPSGICRSGACLHPLAARHTAPTILKRAGGAKRPGRLDMPREPPLRAPRHPAAAPRLPNSDKRTPAGLGSSIPQRGG